MLVDTTAAKNDKSSGFRSAFGGKSTKRRGYEVDCEYFSWYAGHEKEVGEFKTRVAVNTITDVRPFTSDARVNETAPFGFEIETPERTYALGCESQADKEHWMGALQAAKSLL